MISMKKVFMAIIICLIVAIPALSSDSESGRLSCSSQQEIISDEAELLLKNTGYSKKIYSAISIEDEAEKILSKQKLRRPEQKNIIYTDVPVSKTSSKKVFYKESEYTDNIQIHETGIKKNSYTGEIPIISAIPVKIATDKTIQSTIKFYRKNNTVYSYSIPLLNTKYEFRVLEDVVLNNRTIISKGTPVYGYVTFNMTTADFIEISRFYFEKDGERVELLGTIGNGEFSSSGNPIKNQPVSLLSFGTRTKIPFIKLGPPAYIKKNQPYTVYYEYK